LNLFLGFLLRFAAVEVRHIFAYSVYVEATEPTSFATLNVYELNSSVLSKSYILQKGEKYG
jgi:hypothetical protein